MLEWESDPLFAAAEVVQDSADRMDSIFHLLLHEQTLLQVDLVDKKLLSSMEYHRRDLATTLETTRWQLEDFEREVNVSATANNSQMKQNVLARHKQFIEAIREQIIHVEQSMDTSVGNSLRNMNLNKQDSDGLALFLSGGNPVKHIGYQESEDGDCLSRFLDPVDSSSSKEYIDEQKTGETTSLNSNGIAYFDHNLELKEIFPTQLDLGTNHGRYDEEGTRDLEANEVKGKNYQQKNKLRSYYGRMNIFASFANFLSIHGSRGSRSFTKRLKDGEEHRHSPSVVDVHLGMQRYVAQLRSAWCRRNFQLPCPQLSTQIMQSHNWTRAYREKCRRYLHSIQAGHHRVLFVLPVVLTLLVLSVLVT